MMTQRARRAPQARAPAGPGFKRRSGGVYEAAGAAHAHALGEAPRDEQTQVVSSMPKRQPALDRLGQGARPAGRS